jgi:hypothetical protein
MKKAAAPKTGGRMTSEQLWLALERRYPKSEYALLSEVRNNTGNSAAVRTADAIALSLWPSRGLVLNGFEFKAYRGDWKREKDNPQKAEAIAQFCDYWWLVVTQDSVAPVEEIPETWGLLAPDAGGDKLVVVKPAVKMKPLPWSRAFMAAVLRNVSDTTVPSKVVAAKLVAAEMAGFERGKTIAPETELQREVIRLREFANHVATFERASGLRLNEFRYGSNGPEEFGAAVYAVMQARRQHRDFVTHVRSVVHGIETDCAQLTNRLKDAAARVSGALQVHLDALERLSPPAVTDETPQPTEGDRHGA